MIFLIEYNQRRGQVVALTRFDDANRREAEDARLRLELDLNRRGEQHEVVILEADSEETIRRTHRRYFEDIRQIWESGSPALEQSPFIPNDPPAGHEPS